MKRTSRVLLSVACLALAALTCKTVMGGGGSNNPPIIPTNTQPGNGNVLLRDDFSSSHWGTGTDKDSSIEYANQALQVIVYTKNYFVWSTPNDQDYQNVHMEVTVLNNHTEANTAFGLLCNRQASSASFYYFAITPAGQYVIAKVAANENDVFLTNNNAWASSDSIAKNAPSYRLGADCSSGTLTLYVDGQQIASVSDSSYTDGGVGLVIWSGATATSTNISFDDFLMTQLP